MPSRYCLTEMPDQRLLARLAELVHRDFEITADVVAHIAEVDARRLFLGEACSSMFVYCTERLFMSEPQAYKYIRAARAARLFPRIFEMLTAGEIHLAGLTLLAPHLTEDNHGELLAAARRKSKRAIEKLLAETFPNPDVPAMVRKLPVPRMSAAAPVIRSATRPQPAADADADADAATPLWGLESQGPSCAPRPPSATTRPVIAPLSAARFKIQFTADQELHDKLREAQALLRHQIPNGDVAEVMDRALTLLLADVKRKRFAKRKPTRLPKSSSKPKSSSTPTPTPKSESSSAPKPTPKSESRSTPKPGSGQRSRHIPAEVKRAVVARDGQQCAFIDPSGRRCTESGWLEFHHVEAYGKGGEPTAENVALYCRAHNGFAAECDYGAAIMEERKDAARKRRQQLLHQRQRQRRYQRQTTSSGEYEPDQVGPTRPGAS